MPSKPNLSEELPSSGPVKLLVLLEDFTGWERGGGWGDTDFFFSHRNDFEKIAVVGNPKWEAQVLAFTGAGLRKGPVRMFSETSRVRGARLARGVRYVAAIIQHHDMKTKQVIEAAHQLVQTLPRHEREEVPAQGCRSGRHGRTEVRRTRRRRRRRCRRAWRRSRNCRTCFTRRIAGRCCSSSRRWMRRGRTGRSST